MFDKKYIAFFLMLFFMACNAGELLVLGPYRHVRFLKINHKGIQISHKDGTGYLDLSKLSEDDKKLIADEIAEYQECLKNKKKAVAEEKIQKAKAAKEKKSADTFAAAFIRAIGKPKTQSGYLLTTYGTLAKRYKIKMTIPKRGKDGTLPLLYGQYETLRKFVEQKTDGSARQKEALALIDSHYSVYRKQRQVTIYNRNKKLAAQQRKQKAAKPAAKAPAKALAKPAAKPAPKPAHKPAPKPAPAPDMPDGMPPDGFMPPM